MQEAAHDEADRHDDRARDEDRPRPEPLDQVSGDRRQQDHEDAVGQQDEAGLDDGQAETIAGLDGHLDVLRGAEEVGPGIAKPTMIDATFVSRTVRRSEVRMSTRGCPERTSIGLRRHGERGDHDRTSVLRSAQPHEPALDTASRKQVRANEQRRTEIVEAASRPDRRLGDEEHRDEHDDGEAARDEEEGVPVGVDEMTPASGMPTAPPIPRVALISATPEPTLSAGRWSRMMLIPTGTRLVPIPARPRPVTTSASDVLIAATAEPTMTDPRQTMSMRRLPNMSARRGDDRRPDRTRQQGDRDEPGGVLARRAEDLGEPAGAVTRGSAAARRASRTTRGR